MAKIFTIFILVCLSFKTLQDTPANCRKRQAVGTWTFRFTKRSLHNICGVDLSQQPNGWSTFESMTTLDDKEVVGDIELTLNEDHTVTGSLEKLARLTGSKIAEKVEWDMEYNQGFVIHAGALQLLGYFQFSPFEHIADAYTSYCDQIFVGFVQIGRSPKTGCFIGEKTNSVNNFVKNADSVTISSRNWRKYQIPDFLKEQKMEIAKPTETRGAAMEKSNFVAEKKIDRMFRRNLFKNWPVKVQNTKINPNDLPKEFSHEKYLPKVIRQECGSCYAVTSIQVVMSRAKLHLGVDIDVSYKDLLDCNHLSQGCDGGLSYQVFTYLSTHRTKSNSCFEDNHTCGDYCGEKGLRVKKWYRVNHFSGFYPNSEQAIQEEIFTSGPVAINFEVTPSFRGYKGGIYRPTAEEKADYDRRSSVEDQFYPTNHLVVIYGWGETEQGEKYWLIRNSWGTGWGEKGNFKAPRGENMIGIESLVGGCEVELVD